MKLVYMGTPEFAVAPLEFLHNSSHSVVAVVTGPDKPSGRGRAHKATPVRETALRLGITALTPESLKDSALVTALRELEADIFVVVAFRILPEEVFTIPPHGSVNLHASLLPKYRGAAPINWALIEGEKETGLSVFQLKRKVDTGDVLLQERVEINSADTFTTLSERMSRLAGPLLAKSLDLIESGGAIPQRQDSSLASKAPKLTPELFRIDWTKDANSVVNLIRGLANIPGAYTMFRGKRLKILGAGVAEKFNTNVGSGNIDIRDGIPFVEASGATFVELKRVQPEGKAQMSALDFVNGYRVESREKVGAQ
ncbi:MAG: methionyl-tRNA formyltransferase [candidate division Zixibacteria bacterium]|nr:methionyl-tRNA formyltransferase [candidate division Zixibacteria bacterium]